MAEAESMEVVQRSASPGIQLVQVSKSPRVWSHVNSSFCFCRAWDWSGRVDYRRQSLSLGRGDTFLFEPGEFFAAQPYDSKAGSFRVVEVQVTTLEALCRVEGHPGPFHFSDATITAASPIAAALSTLEQALLSDAEPLELQSRAAVLANAAISTVLEPTRRRERNHPIPRGHCELLREILHSPESSQLNLADFAQELGVSQYRLLRAFKRRYGAPPHAYGLHVRIERARQMLHRGSNATDAAAANDFADQSHFTRHFRRVWSLTPGQYAAGL
jgi:AraC-like DNA-binding protein